MQEYVVLDTLDYDNRRYEPGERISLSQDAAVDLLQLRVVEPVSIAPPETVQAPEPATQIQPEAVQAAPPPTEIKPPRRPRRPPAPPKEAA